MTKEINAHVVIFYQPVKHQLQDFEVLVPSTDGHSVIEKVTVPVPMIWDEDLGEFLLTPEAHEIIETTKARYMGLLLPAQLLELRDRLNLTQHEIGELLQIGEKSWSRWEGGKQRPSRSFNLLLRALYDGEISIEYLAHISGVRPAWNKIIRCKFFKVGAKRPILMNLPSRSQRQLYPGAEETPGDPPITRVA
jgi:DNA-binding transcriptional regulator YiaG